MKEATSSHSVAISSATTRCSLVKGTLTIAFTSLVCANFVLLFDQHRRTSNDTEIDPFGAPWLPWAGNTNTTTSLSMVHVNETDISRSFSMLISIARNGSTNRDAQSTTTSISGESRGDAASSLRVPMNDSSHHVIMNDAPPSVNRPMNESSALLFQSIQASFDNKSDLQLLARTNASSSSSLSSLSSRYSNGYYYLDGFPRQPRPRPSLKVLVQGENVTGDISWLLNVAVIGMAKCGTSTLMYQLRNHPEVQMFGRERCEMSVNAVSKLTRDLYNKYPRGDYVRGIKCPSDLDSARQSLRNYRTYFPNADFIVGLRHPILWFESFYNFRVHNEYDMKPIKQLIGSCIKGSFGVCTMRGNFHYFLGNLGKVHDETAARYFPRFLRKHQDPVLSSARVFFYEVSQLSDPHPQRSQQFLNDLQQFLHLRQPFPPMMWFKPGKNHTSDKLRRLEANKVNICERQYGTLRHVLLQQAINASRWIREYFIDAPDVVVSSKDYLVNHILPKWEIDPCLERQRNISMTATA